MTWCRVDVFKLSIDRGGFECRSPSGTKLNYVDMAMLYNNHRVQHLRPCSYLLLKIVSIEL